MKPLCTGNPNRHTLAWAASQKWPETECISRSSGWNLLMDNHADISKFQNKILDHNVFINSSYIGPNVQKQLLELTVNKWMERDIKGHVFTIGTTAEWNPDLYNQSYVTSKIDLRRRCLEVNDQTGITGVKSTYIILGGVNDGKPENQYYIDPLDVMDVIETIINIPDRVALIQLDRRK